MKQDFQLFTRTFRIPRSLIVGIFFLISCSILVSTNAHASSKIYYTEYAMKLAEVGVFKGTGTSYELDREPTRLEGLIMLIRLLGKEADALKVGTQPSAFSDVPDWGRGYVNYAYQNNITKGLGNQLFGTNEKIDANSYSTFLLRSLGYRDSGNAVDFSWSQATDYAKKIGLIDEDLYFKIVTGTFTRDFVAKSSYNTLYQKLKGSETTLLQQLANTGVISSSQLEKINAPITSNPISTPNTDLTSQEIAKLADAVVYIEVTRYDGSVVLGSGFYISSDGNIATNFHVIEGAKSLKIVENDGQVYSGAVKVIGYDSVLDLAALDIDRTVKLFLRTGNSDLAKLGEEIYTIGSPRGLKNTITNGIISSFREGDIQISAPISPGSSGGVLLNKQGLAIGITTSGIPDGQNIGFAVPINQFLKMPRNLQLSLDALYKSTSMQKMSYPRYEDLLLSKYNKLTVGGSTVFFRNAVISNNEYRTNSLVVVMYIDPSTSSSFQSILQSYQLSVEQFLATISSEVGKYYSMNVSGYLIYSDSFYSYPAGFVNNLLFSQAVTYNKDSGRWDVFYPYLLIDYNVATNRYTSKWAF